VLRKVRKIETRCLLILDPSPCLSRERASAPGARG